MSNEPKGPEADAGAAAVGKEPLAEPEAGRGGENGARAEQPRPDAAQLEAIVKALQDEIAQHSDTNLRLRAEMENLRKRFEREKAETAKYAIGKFAQDVVNIGDNFQRAIAAVPPGAADQDAALKSFLDGVLLAEREFIKVLERNGVLRIDPKGEPFNPKIHNAVMEQENKDVPAATVLQVFQAGYMIEDRCLRPALVVVSRGGAKMPRPAPAAEGQQQQAGHAPGAAEGGAANPTADNDQSAGPGGATGGKTSNGGPDQPDAEGEGTRSRGSAAGSGAA